MSNSDRVLGAEIEGRDVDVECPECGSSVTSTLDHRPPGESVAVDIDCDECGHEGRYWKP